MAKFIPQVTNLFFYFYSFFGLIILIHTYFFKVKKLNYNNDKFIKWSLKRVDYIYFYFEKVKRLFVRDSS